MDYEGDLSSLKIWFSLWAFCSSKLTFLGILDDLVQSQNNLRVQHLFFPQTEREDCNSSKESTISTSLIHNKASDGKSEQVVTGFLNRIFHAENDCGEGNLSNCISEICCDCCPNHGILLKFKNSQSTAFLQKSALELLILSVFTCVNSLHPSRLRSCFWISLLVVRLNSLDMISG